MEEREVDQKRSEWHGLEAMEEVGSGEKGALWQCWKSSGCDQAGNLKVGERTVDGFQFKQEVQV